jgi:hypothetical protein
VTDCVGRWNSSPTDFRSVKAVLPTNLAVEVVLLWCSVGWRMLVQHTNELWIIYFTIWSASWWKSTSTTW